MFWSRREERKVYLAIGDGRSCIWLYARLHCWSSVWTSCLCIRTPDVSFAPTGLSGAVSSREVETKTTRTATGPSGRTFLAPPC